MDAYNDFMDSLEVSILTWADPNKKCRGYTEGWPLTDFRTAGTVALLYLAFVGIGSTIMKAGVPTIDPYPLKFVYNVSQIMLSSYMTIEAVLLAYRNGYTVLPCNPYDRDSPPISNLLWLFYMSKAWDFSDTVFIILGKKWRQLSFLHVYHHFTTFLFYWLNSHVNYDGDIYLTVILNGFIHSIMYTYYFICMHTKVPRTGESLPIWWKSSLTMMQMIQFVTMMSQATYLLATQCKTVSLNVVATYLIYVLSLFILFAQFYAASYSKPNRNMAGRTGNKKIV